MNLHLLLVKIVLAADHSCSCLAPGKACISRIQYSDRALERLLARDVPSAAVTAKDAAVCQSAPTTHPHNVPGILVSPFFLLFFLSFTFRRGNCYHFLLLFTFFLYLLLCFSLEKFSWQLFYENWTKKIYQRMCLEVVY